MATVHVAYEPTGAELSYVSVTTNHRRVHKLRSPYKPPATGANPFGDDARGAKNVGLSLGIAFVFSLPAGILILLSLLTIGLEKQHWIVWFFIFGAHGIVLLICWVAAIVLAARLAHGNPSPVPYVGVAVGLLYSVSFFICWSVVALFTWMNTIWWP